MYTSTVHALSTSRLMTYKHTNTVGIHLTSTGLAALTPISLGHYMQSANYHQFVPMVYLLIFCESAEWRHPHSALASV